MDRECTNTSRVKIANPDAKADKPCIYVGSTTKTPEERFRQHIEGARNNRGPLFSRIVRNYGVRLRPRLYEKHNPLNTREEAEAKEQELTIKYRQLGYTVWSK